MIAITTEAAIQGATSIGPSNASMPISTWRRSSWLLPWTALWLVGCGGDGGGGASPTPTPSPTLISIALTPASLSLEPNATATVGVIGTYSDGSTKSLAAAGELFRSSNTAVAAVSASGVVAARCGAPTGATATITATDSASGLTTAASSATQVSLGTTLTLCSIALQPPTLSLAPLGAAQLTVIGTYSDGTVQALAAANESFAISNAAVASISAAGVLTVAAGAPTGTTATATARDIVSGLGTSASASTVITVSPSVTLSSIALSPATLVLAPNATAQVTVTGTYSDGSTQVLPATEETFSSSNGAVATVAANGVVTISGTAMANATATISAADPTTNLSTAAANSTQVTVSGVSSNGPPTATSASAAATTAQKNAQCTVIQPFYWEIGDANSALASGSPTPSGGSAVTASSRFSIASASKWIYGMYVVQKRGAAANLTDSDIQFLTFQSGYTYMGSDTSGATCTAPSSGADSINNCLTLPSTTTPGKFMNSQNPTTTGVFDYDSGHEENHAGQFQPEINALDTTQLGSTINAGLGISGITLRYNQPLLAGGIYASAADYTPILRAVLSGQLAMLEAWGTNAVCAWSVGTGCSAAFSPINAQHWHYSIAHWVEDDPATGDGAFSSAGAFGFYPWIEANKRYYGVISRYAPATGAIQNGLQSALCGHEIRAAWESGQAQ